MNLNPKGYVISGRIIVLVGSLWLASLWAVWITTKVTSEQQAAKQFTTWTEEDYPEEYLQMIRDMAGIPSE